MLIVNLAISDFFIFLTQGPAMFINAFSSRFWMFGASFCRIYGFLGSVFGKHTLVSTVTTFFDNLKPRGNCKRQCFDQLNAHILERQQNSKRYKMWPFSWSKHVRSQSPLVWSLWGKTITNSCLLGKRVQISCLFLNRGWLFYVISLETATLIT